VRVFACVRESVFLKGLEAVFPQASGELHFCGGCVEEATLFERLPAEHPDLILFEVSSISQLPFLNILRRNYPDLCVVALLDCLGTPLEHLCWARGVRACISKREPGESLSETLAFLGNPGASGEPASTPLTPKEVEVLRLVAMGRPNRQIARELFVSELTIKTHLNSIYQKLQVRGRVDAALAYLGGLSPQA